MKTSAKRTYRRKDGTVYYTFDNKRYKMPAFGTFSCMRKVSLRVDIDERFIDKFKNDVANEILEIEKIAGISFVFSNISIGSDCEDLMNRTITIRVTHTRIK